MTITVTAPIAYVRDTGMRPRYYANAHEKDTIVVAPVPMPIADMRGSATSLQHLEDNHRAWGLPVAPDVLAAAGALINEDTVAGHRYHDAIKPTIDTEEFEPA